MHLLLIHQNFPGQFRELAPAWLAAGHQVSAIGSVPEAPDGPQWDGLAYWAYSFSDQADHNPTPLQRGQAVAQLCHWLQGQQSVPDLVMVHSGWGEALLLRSALGSIPWVVYPELWGTPQALGLGVDDALSPLQRGQRPWGLEARLEQQNLLADLAILQADAVVVPSESQRLSFPTVLQPRLEVIPEGVNLQRLQPDPAASIELEGVGRLRAGDPVVTLVSRALEPLRGLRAALQAWPQVAAQQPDARLLLVGGTQKGYGEEPPKGETHLADALERLPPSVDRSRIHVLTPLPYADLVALLQCSACHLGLSYPYTLSWSLLEAMACGAPLVSNHGSPLAHVVRDRQQALLVQLNDPALLAAAICDLLQDPQLGREIGLAGRRLIQEQFSLEQALLAYQALFERLIAKR